MKVLSGTSNIKLSKNQLLYKDDRMQIWANDNRGYYHNYSPNDSSEYRFVTNHIGSNEILDVKHIEP